MKALILAAGFGTRLQSGLNGYEGPNKSEVQKWVEGKPKGLVLIKGKPIIDYVFHQMTEAGIQGSNIFVQTNARYFDQYSSWAREKGIPSDNILNDGIQTNDNRLGILGDLKHALEHKMELVQDDLLVMASDTLVYGNDGKLYDFGRMIECYEQDKFPRLVVYQKTHDVSKHGVVEVNTESTVVSVEEKPEAPKSDLVIASVYIYNSHMLQEFLEQYDTMIQAKHPFKYFCDQGVQLKAEKASSRLDIGTIDDVLRANET